MALSSNLTRLFPAVALALSLTACGGGDSAPVPVEFSTVSRGSFPALAYYTDSFQSRLARSDSEWQALWFSHTGANPPPPAPAVDFRRWMVIGLFLGGRPSGCYDIQVREVLLLAQAIEVVYTEDTPNGSGCPAVIVSPYEFISIPTTALPVRFRKM